MIDGVLVEPVGLLDIMAARAHVPTIPITPQGGELIWLEQPSADPLKTAWSVQRRTAAPHAHAHAVHAPARRF